MMTDKEMLEIRLANQKVPHKPHCEYCGHSLPPKYTSDGGRIPKSGGFWGYHMENCKARQLYLLEKDIARWKQEEQEQESEQQDKIDTLTDAGFSQNQATTLMHLFGKEIDD